jgi:hypothetical protein
LIRMTKPIRVRIYLAIAGVNKLKRAEWARKPAGP